MQKRRILKVPSRMHLSRMHPFCMVAVPFLLNLMWVPGLYLRNHIISGCVRQTLTSQRNEQGNDGSIMSAPSLPPPFYSTYVDKINTWWGDAVAEEIGATNSRGYNIVNLAFWTPKPDGSSKPLDIALVWKNIDQYGLDGKFGGTAEEIRANLRKAYHDQGARVLVSAFGATSFPTTEDIPAKECGENLAQWVIDMQLDGVDLDYEDNGAMENGTAVPRWLVDMTDAMMKTFAATGQEYMITHAPQAPYFMDRKYKHNYVYLHNSKLSDGTTVGDHIHSYLIQFYNQGTSEYSTYESLFLTSDGWANGSSIQEIADKGIPMEKLSVGKPVTRGDAVNSGYVSPDELASFFKKAREEGPWKTDAKVGGVMGWQFASDPEGEWIAKLKQAINL